MPVKKSPKAVVVTTENRGVFFGYIVDDSQAPAQITLSQCRNALYWPQSVKGFLGLASSGPSAGSRIGPVATESTLYRLTSITTCTPEAVSAWEAGQWG